MSYSYKVFKVINVFDSIFEFEYAHTWHAVGSTYKSILLRLVCTCRLIRCFCQGIDCLLWDLIHLTAFCNSFKGLIHLSELFFYVKGSYMLNGDVIRVLYRVFVYFAQVYAVMAIRKYSCLLNSYLKRFFVRYFDIVSTFFNT